jgi:hypothetical protein
MWRAEQMLHRRGPKWQHWRIERPGWLQVQSCVQLRYSLPELDLHILFQKAVMFKKVKSETIPLTGHGGL